MKYLYISILLLTSLFVNFSFMAYHDSWKKKEGKKFDFFITQKDEVISSEINKILSTGIKKVEQFTGSKYQNKFEVFVHPDRISLDKQWQADWNMPDFKSECWMVASGVGAKLDFLSPQEWKNQACEHKYENAIETQRLLTHELFHVYHGQINESHDFSSVDTLDWFVEGFAVFASEQLDTARTRKLKELIWFNQAPEKLINFWVGKHKYALAGSMVSFIDQKYGRKKLLTLLKCKSLYSVLTELNQTEEKLIKEWKEYASK